MTKQQATQYKRNYVDNKIMEFVCKTGREPSAATLSKWGKEADQKLTSMRYQIQEWTN